MVMRLNLNNDLDRKLAMIASTAPPLPHLLQKQAPLLGLPSCLQRPWRHSKPGRPSVVALAPVPVAPPYATKGELARTNKHAVPCSKRTLQQVHLTEGLLIRCICVLVAVVQMHVFVGT